MAEEVEFTEIDYEVMKTMERIETECFPGKSQPCFPTQPKTMTELKEKLKTHYSLAKLTNAHGNILMPGQVMTILLDILEHLTAEPAKVEAGGEGSCQFCGKQSS